MADNKLDMESVLTGVAVVFVILCVLGTIIYLFRISDKHADKISKNNTSVQIARIHACDEITDINQRIACFAVIGANDTTRK